MGLLDDKKEPLLEGLKQSNSIALPAALWKAIDAEVLRAGAKSRSAFMTDAMIWVIYELRKRRGEADESPKTRQK